MAPIDPRRFEDRRVPLVPLALMVGGRRVILAAKSLARLTDEVRLDVHTGLRSISNDVEEILLEHLPLVIVGFVWELPFVALLPGLPPRHLDNIVWRRAVVAVIVKDDGVAHFEMAAATMQVVQHTIDILHEPCGRGRQNYRVVRLLSHLFSLSFAQNV